MKDKTIILNLHLLVLGAIAAVVYRNDWTSISLLVIVLIAAIVKEYSLDNPKQTNPDENLIVANLDSFKLETLRNIDLINSRFEQMSEKFKHIQDLAEKTEAEINKHNLNQGFKTLGQR